MSDVAHVAQRTADPFADVGPGQDGLVDVQQHVQRCEVHAEVARHLVVCPGELGDLVASLHWNLGREVLSRDPPRAGEQLLERRDETLHLARAQRQGEHRSDGGDPEKGAAG
jgi:hypothetical protein